MGWLIIPVEVQARELLARLLVAAVAADRGYDVLIGHDRVIRRLARFLPKGLLFDKSLGSVGERKVRRYSRLGYTITAIDEESTGFYPNPDVFLSTRLSSESLDRAARWFCISDRLRNEVRARYPDHDDRFVTTGLPRTDTWRREFHGLFEPERQRIREIHGDFILFCSNFGAIIHAREDRFVEHQLQKQAMAYPGASAYQQKIASQGQCNLDAFAEMLPKLADWFPDQKIIIRPHPSEDQNFWRELAAGHPRVEVHQTGLATPWILASNCLVHHGCTTGIEAELTGRPHIMYAPRRDDHHDTEVMRAFATIVKDETSLRKAIGEMLSGDRSRAKERRSLERYYAALEGPLVAERIVDALAPLAVQGSNFRLPAYLTWLRFAPRNLVAEYWPRSARHKNYSRQKWQGTTLTAVDRDLKILCSAAGIRSALTATEIFPQLFLIRAGTGD